MISSVLVPNEISVHSPSCVDGIGWDLETTHRIFGCSLIQQGGVLLKCPQVVMVTAQNIYHRFYYRSVNFALLYVCI